MRNPSFLTVTRTAIPPPLTAVLCGGGKSGIVRKGNRNHGPQSAGIKMATSLVTRIAIENRNREHDRSKKGDIQHGSEWPCGRSPRCKDYDGECSSTSKHERSCGHEGPFDDRKAKQRCRASTSPSCGCKKLHTPKRRPLMPPPISHSTPLAAPPKLSSDPASTRLSFNQSRSLLPPLELGEGDAPPIPSLSMPVQAGAPSVVGPLPLPSMSVSALNLMADHTKIIFNLACEGWHLKERVAREFTRLSSEEVLFRTQA